jgi:hypothetical protein
MLARLRCFWHCVRTVCKDGGEALFDVVVALHSSFLHAEMMSVSVRRAVSCQPGGPSAAAVMQLGSLCLSAAAVMQLGATNDVQSGRLVSNSLMPVVPRPFRDSWTLDAF